jgi:hypothetical protein
VEFRCHDTQSLRNLACVTDHRIVRELPDHRGHGLAPRRDLHPIPVIRTGPRPGGGGELGRSRIRSNQDRGFFAVTGIAEIKARRAEFTASGVVKTFETSSSRRTTTRSRRIRPANGMCWVALWRRRTHTRAATHPMTSRAQETSEDSSWVRQKNRTHDRSPETP